MEFKHINTKTILRIFYATIITIAISYLLYKSFIFIILTPLTYWFLKKIIINLNEKKDKKKFKNEFKDFLYVLSGSFSTGRHLVEALQEVNVSLSKMYSKDSQIMVELNTILLQLKLTGYDEIKVLENFKQRKPIEDVIDFVEMYKSCRDTGGDFAGVLSKGASMIAEKITIDREIEAITYQKKIEGRVIGTMPVVLLIFLNIFSPDYISPLYSGLSGRMIMTFALVLTVFAFAMIERITNIEV
ncbi:hypothetical protein HMPREF1635_03225 [Clostridiales bacterium S5-A14a]|nr:hypothetical protein HMPREF1635_03225 [Clostridiales bacterium S5-A14a]